MSTRTLIENWLSQSSLVAGGLRALDADGFWAVPYGSITLTLAVPEEEAFFVLYAPLMSVSGGSAQVLARFYRRLLIWQLEGNLPTGMAFGMDYDGTLVSVVGQYRVQGLDAVSFDALLRDASVGAEELRPRLEALFVEFLTEEKSSGLESQPQAEAVREDSSLSDRDLLHTRLLQGMRY